MIGATESMVLERKELMRVLWTYGDTHILYVMNAKLGLYRQGIGENRLRRLGCIDG